MSNEQQSHDSRDQVWNLPEPHRSGQRGQWGGTAQDNRRSINGVFWILHTGAHGGGCRRATGNGVLYISIFADEPDLEWPMIDVSHCKVHPHAAEAKSGNQDMSRTKGDSIPRFTLSWMQMVCRSEYMLQRVSELIAKKLFT